MRAIAFVFARGGSKGLPGKNLRMLGGKPLIAWAIQHGLAVSRISRVIVSTDSQEIAEVAREHGAEVPFLRPTELAQDNSPEWLAWRHALAYVEAEASGLPDAMVSLPATAPLRTPDDVDRCLDAFFQGDADVVITVSPAHRSPYFNMVKSNPDGTVGLVMPPPEGITRRQDVPPVYDMATIAYVARPSFVLEQGGIFEGRVRAVQVPQERAIDIDTIHDFRLAEFFLSAGGKGEI